MKVFWFLDCGQIFCEVVLRLPQQSMPGIPGQVLCVFLHLMSLNLYFIPRSEFLRREAFLYSNIIPSDLSEIVGRVCQDYFTRNIEQTL